MGADEITFQGIKSAHRRRLRVGDLVRIADGIREIYVQGLSVATGWPAAIMWTEEGLNGGPEGTEFLQVPWDAVGVVTGFELDGPNQEPLVRVMFPQGIGSWWPDHFERVKGSGGR